ncbi:hypothetical protein NBRC116592_22590 [Colwellia sp. KU-HH00111]|uniref:FHA domain-containing protein n=1 Tax=Colwellia sp. KU-HH00111 TaxID=3127652 RepID=UPI003102CB84
MELTTEELRTQQGSIEKTPADEIIIEEISRNHKLLHRHKLSQAQIHIGRDYHNDIILADPHICPSHLSLEYIDGNWVIADNQTVNGSFIENIKEKKHPANNHVVCDGDVITLGKSQLRIFFTNHPVAPTVAFSPFESFINLMRHPIALLLSIAIFSLIAAGVFYLNTPKEVNFSQLLVPTITMAVGFALWPAGVALVSHLSKHDARVMAQLGISFAFFNLMWLGDFLGEIAAFNSASDAIMPIVAILISAALAYSLFWLNGYIGFHMSAKRRNIVAASITILLFGGSYLVQYSNKAEFNARPEYDATLMMPSFLLAPSSTTDKFIADSGKLFDKTSKKAKQK